MDKIINQLKTQPVVNQALKGVAVTAGLGLIWWTGKQLIGAAATPPTLFEQLSLDANQALASDPEVRAACELFRKYARYDERSYAQLLVAWTEIITLYTRLVREEIRPKMSHPRLVSAWCTTVVDSIRKLRAVVCAQSQNHAGTLASFDESASDFQRLCNQYTHNITKTVEYQQIR
jgi:uncharacterized protein (UPF0305 family)